MSKFMPTPTPTPSQGFSNRSEFVMKTRSERHGPRAILLLASLLAAPLIAFGAVTDLSDTPLSGATKTQIKPNVLFIMDDSYSMKEDFLPDWAGGIKYSSSSQWTPSFYQSKNASFNGIAYDPAVTYLPPSFFNAAGLEDPSVYPSQTKTGTTDWTEVLIDGYGVQSTGKVNLIGQSYYFVTEAGEFCTDETLRDCDATQKFCKDKTLGDCAATEDADAGYTVPAYTVPAYLRWCKNAANAEAAAPTAGACQAVMIAAIGTTVPYMYPRMPAPRMTRMSTSGSGATTVSSITVDGKQILNGVVNANTAADLASAIRNSINACAYAKAGGCQVAGYSAMRGSSDTEIVLHAPGDISVAPVVKFSGGISVAHATPFGPGNNVPGVVKKTVIVPEVGEYAKRNPGKESRKDCGDENFCTYAEEMTNYANWYAYYRTRMQAMKTATSRAFASIDDRYRIGYYSINNNTDQDFQNVSDFVAQQKLDWYKKLFEATPFRSDGAIADTPLRKSLSDAGWLFAGKTKNSGDKLNGVDIIDPVQHYCQPNVTILSTDGYWNMDAGFTLTGDVEDQDGRDEKEPTLDYKSEQNVARPQLDGGAGVRQKRTEQLYKTLTPIARTWRQDKVEKIQAWFKQPMLYTEDAVTRRIGQLQKRNPTWTKKEYRLTKLTRTLVKWYSYTVTGETRYKRYTAPLTKTTNTQLKSVQKLHTRSLVEPQYREGTLKTIPKKLFDKTTYTLMKKVIKVSQTKSDEFGNLTTTTVDKCTTEGGTTCAWVTVSDAPDSSCTHNPEEIEGPKADITYDTYHAGVHCYYSPGLTDTNVSVCDSEPRQAGPSYTRGYAVECSEKTPSVWNNSATSCNPVTEVCDYNWGTGWKPVPSGETCNATNPAVVQNYQAQNVKECQTGSSEWTLVTSGNCVKTTSVDCDYYPYPPVEEPSATCNPAPLTGDNITYNLLELVSCRTTTSQSTVSGTNACTPGSTGGVTTTCSYGTWTQTGDNLTSCTNYNANKTGTEGGTPTSGPGYTGPGIACESYLADANYTNTSCPPGSTNCENKSYWNAGVYSHTNTCAVETEPEPTTASIGSTYVSWCGYRHPNSPGSSGPLTQGGLSSCVQTDPSTPPTNDSIPVDSSSGTQLNYIRACTKVWPAVWTDVTSGTCTKDRSSTLPASDTSGTEDCRYLWPSTSENLGVGGTCVPNPGPSDPPLPAEGAEGSYSVLKPVACGLTFNNGVPVTSCPATLPSNQTCSEIPELRDITDPSFDPTSVNLNDTNLYSPPAVTRSWGTFDAGTGVLSSDPPKATQATPLPSNDGYCEAGPDGAEKVTYEIDPTDGLKRITCRAVAPGASDGFPVASCGPAIPGVKVDCPPPHKTGPVDDPTCGRLSDGTFVDVIEPNELNTFTKTTCTSGDGTPTKETLADVAEYYWKTDLRSESLGNCTGGPIDGTSNDVCSNTSRTSPWSWQNMRTFTLGLGASGVMQYRKDYDDEKLLNSSEIPDGRKGDYYSILKGSPADPENGVCSWQTLGSPCNWPKPGLSDPGGTAWQTNIDDLWHAAVNGRGQYFSAQNPGEVSSSLSSALNAVMIKEGGLSEPVISDPNLAKGDVRGFVSSFTAEQWTGSLQMFDVSAVGAAVKPERWSAQIPSVRTILTFDSSASGNLKPFAWASLTATEQAYFKKDHINSLSQFCSTGTICLSAATKNDADLGKKLVGFLRGDQSNEGPVNATDKPFRQREGLLGDIVNSTAAYVQKAPWLYTDNGYSQYRLTTVNRAGRVYVGANDGMLHAFDAANGKEVWAYVPNFLMPGLFRLADKYYANKHHFYVDGSPVSGDICTENCAFGGGTAVWKTILVGGANAGGRGYYALDVTDPDSPKGLWEFTDANLGYTYGNPIITKLGGLGTNAGKWVVIFASGYNNNDGNGRLFVLDAHTGQEIIAGGIPTGVGSPTDPSGLAKIAGWASNLVYNNTVRHIYGGDLKGNLWRFDINDSASTTAHLLAVLKDSDGDVQPITSTPEIGLIKTKPVVFIGTGQLLGNSDLATRGTHSFYAIKDELGSTTYDDLRGSGDFVEQTMTSGLCPDSHEICEAGSPIVTVTKKPVTWATDSGWYVDFPVAGERVNTTTRLVRGTLSITTNTPKDGGACVPAGVSFKYFLDYRTGGYVVEGGYAGGKLGDFFSTSGPVGSTAEGGIMEIGRGDGFGVDSVNESEIHTGSPAASMRRISWKELISE
jgi:Tfp pilus tip-associated adhesin PilY1